ncbi:MAG: hypothetical protein ACU84J_06450 [Gammaproteobacteria bacterium]
MSRKRLLFLLLMLGSTPMHAWADLCPQRTIDMEKIFNWAENTYPEYFPRHDATKSGGGWHYRHYHTEQYGSTYAGVKGGDVYVLGGPWDPDEPTYIDTIDGLIRLIRQTGGNVNVPLCAAETRAPAGLLVTQQAVNLKVSSCGGCVSSSELKSFCDVPQPATPTGVHVLFSPDIINFNSTITAEDPLLQSVKTFITDSFVKSSICIVNAPRGYANMVTSVQNCIDVTDEITGRLPDGSDRDHGLTHFTPYTIDYHSVARGNVVGNCFATDAGIIYDAFSKTRLQ